MSSDEKEAQRRAAQIAGLREMLDFLEAHPDVPMPYFASLERCVTIMGPGVGGEWGERPDEEGVGEVARVAGLLGVDVEGDGPDVEASRKFGAATVPDLLHWPEAGTRLECAYQLPRQHRGIARKRTARRHASPRGRGVPPGRFV